MMGITTYSTQTVNGRATFHSCMTAIRTTTTSLWIKWYHENIFADHLNQMSHARALLGFDHWRHRIWLLGQGQFYTGDKLLLHHFSPAGLCLLMVFQAHIARIKDGFCKV